MTASDAPTPVKIKRGRGRPPLPPGPRAAIGAAIARARWDHDGRETLLVLFAELRRRVVAREVTTIEILGAVRALTEALTADLALSPPPEPPEDAGR